MAEPELPRPHRVEVTASFLERLASIEDFLVEADAAFAYDELLTGLRNTVVPNLARFPRIGKRYLDQPPQSAEALAQLAQLPAGSADALRVYWHGDYLMLYAAAEQVIRVWTIHHRQQLSFEADGLWSGVTEQARGET